MRKDGRVLRDLKDLKDLKAPEVKAPEVKAPEVKKTPIRWTDQEWDRLADSVCKTRKNSPDSVASIANRLQKQFPQDRQRPGILTTSLLRPLVERVQAREREESEKAAKCEELKAKLTLFGELPSDKESILKTLTDEEVLQHFRSRVLDLLSPADIVGSFPPDALLDVMSTPDLAAVTARRVLLDLQRPTPVFINASEPTEVRSLISPPKASNGRKRRVLIVGVNDGNQRRIVTDSVGQKCELRFLDSDQLRRDMIPTAVDCVVVWASKMSHKSWQIVRSSYSPRIVTEHRGGIDNMVQQVEKLCTALR